ncbi:MAG TPA: hypothetical protein VK815_18100 [Candidatus Acidoferrales bacterium]|jgi:hypothetical protein|nr:hypothetical protein [Candidatus Acidoferrales bacterium]
MTNPLLGCDPKEVSPARAGAVFSEFAKNLCTKDGIDFTAAWNKAKELHPDLHARMCEGSAKPSTLDNDETPPARPAPLAQKAFLLPAFYLPPVTSDEIFSVAWAANGNQSVAVDPKKVFLKLVAYTMQTNGLNAADARRQLQDNFPQLARAAGQMPDQQ